MLIDLDLKGREALIVGGGAEAEFKASKLMDGGAKISVMADDPTRRLESLASKGKKVELVRVTPTVEEAGKAVERLRPRVVFVATGNASLDEEIGKVARAGGALVCVRDTPRLNDFNMPAIASVGGIRVGVSTDGSSPAMAGMLGRKFGKLITREEVLQVKLQGHLRKLSKEAIKGPDARKDFVYEVIGDKKVRKLLRKNRYAEARRRGESLLRRAAERQRKKGKGTGARKADAKGEG